MSKSITSQTLQRLPMYFNYLMSLSGKRRNGNICIMLARCNFHENNS